MKMWHLGLTLGSFTQFTAGLLAANIYTITDLGSLGGASYAQGINNLGQVVGYFDTGGGNYRAFEYTGGSMHDLLVDVSGKNCTANAINDSGMIVGTFGDNDSLHAFTFDAGTLTDLGTLGGVQSAGYAINASGDVVGNAFVASGQSHPFLYSRGVMHDLGTLPDNEQWSHVAYGVNDAGRVVGLVIKWGFQSFSYINGVLSDLGPGGAVAINNNGHIIMDNDAYAVLDVNGTMTYLGPGTARDINNEDQIVGNGFAFQRAVIFEAGAVLDLNTMIDPNSGWFLEDARGINDLGDIVGTGLNRAGQRHAFMLTPVDASVLPDIPFVPLKHVNGSVPDQRVPLIEVCVTLCLLFAVKSRLRT